MRYTERIRGDVNRDYSENLLSSRSVKEWRKPRPWLPASLLGWLGYESSRRKTNQAGLLVGYCTFVCIAKWAMPGEG